jgi:hypothetical protein
LAVRNFRGIRLLDWSPRPGLNCLIGPGDSTKTTILDAISLVLAHRWNVAFSDADFYQADPSIEISIEVTLASLQEGLLDSQVFGQHLRGVCADGSVVDEPFDDAEPAITIRLTVDASLEPIWALIRDVDAEPRRLSALQRENLLALRIDESARVHLGWSTPSALARITDASPGLALTLADAQRAARTAVFASPDPQLQKAAHDAAETIRASAAADLTDPRPGLDPAHHLRSGALVLHDGAVPITSRGLGTRRLSSLAIQRSAVGSAGCVIVDELEYGLEPHRVRQLVREFSNQAGEGVQVFLTTHSTITIENLDVTDLAIARSSNGATTVLSVPEHVAVEDDSWQRLARSGPSALLASYIVVCEGATEVGLVGALMRHFDEFVPVPAALRGVAVMNGGGSEAPGRALCLTQLGYDVALIVDHDVADAQAGIEAARAVGCEIVQWTSPFCLETAITHSVSVDALSAFVDLAVAQNESESPSESIRESIAARLTGTPPPGLDLGAWVEQYDESPLRAAIGAAANKAGWFKTESKGEVLGRFVADQLNDVAGTTLAEEIERLRSFTHPTPT